MGFWQVILCLVGFIVVLRAFMLIGISRLVRYGRIPFLAPL